jgi:NADH-quinone oxidoreductase subunit A
MSPLAAYALLFVAVGAGFIFVHLVAGWLIRPSKPDVEKGTIYECGEPTIGSAWVQFDVRYYVIALLFVIFDVEVAFFFPWAEVFGTANAVANAPEPTDLDSARDYAARVLNLSWEPTEKPATLIDQRTGKPRVNHPFENANRYRNVLAAESWEQAKPLVTRRDWNLDREAARDLAWMTLMEVVLFFGILLVGFAYLWRLGDLAWVRSVSVSGAPPNPLAQRVNHPLAQRNGEGSSLARSASEGV